MSTSQNPGQSSPELPVINKAGLNIKNKAVLFGFLTFIILFILIGTLVYQRYLIKRDNKLLTTHSTVIAARNRLQDALAKSVAAIKTLSFFIQANGTVRDFDSVAAEILKDNSLLHALELVPDGVIRYVYPLKGNETVIDYNMLGDSTRNKEAFKAIQKKDIFFAGPFKLKQGGLGIVGRLPVYRNKKFWGFSAVVIKISDLIAAAGIDTTGASGYYFQFSKINPDSGKEEFFISPNREKIDTDVISIDIPNGEWKLSASPVNMNAGYADIFWLGLLGFLFSAIGGVFVYSATMRPENLRQLVKKRTAELAGSEERYRSLIEQASDGIIVYSFDGIIHQFNKRAYIESGYTREEFAKLNLTDLLAGKKMTMRQSKADAVQAGKTAIIERKMIKKDGSLIDIEINVSMLPDENLLAFVRNITERKNAENALRESEQKFSRVFQSDLVGIAIADEAGMITDINEYFAAMLELNRQDVIGRNTTEEIIFGKVNESTREKVREKLKQLVTRNGRVKNHEIEIESSQRTIYLLFSLVPLDLNDKKHWLITAVDITDKKNAELHLSESEKKYRSLIEQASDGIVISDLEGKILEVNNSICNLAGYRPEEIIGRPVDYFLPKEDLASNPLRIEDLLQGGSLLYERKLQKKTGEALDVEVNSKMASHNTLIGFVRDITERKKAAEELRSSNDRFELIARATNDAIWQHDLLTNETSGNENLYRMYGFQRGVDKITYKKFMERVHPDDQERLKVNFDNVVAKGESLVTEEFRFLAGDGTYKNIYDRAFVTYDDLGNAVKITGVMQDITIRVNSEKGVLKEKELLDSLINSLPGVFYLYDKEGKFLRWNKNFEIVTGYSESEMQNIHPLDLFDENEKLLLSEKINNVFKVGQDYVEANFLTRSKEKIPYYFSGIMIKYEGEYCLMGFGIDFTDKVRSQRAVKESEEKFRALIEQASDGVIIMSPEGKALYISPSVERITGYSEEKWANMDMFELVHPEDLTEVEIVVKKVTENPGLPFSHTFRFIHNDGSWKWLESTLTNMMHIASINGIVENFRDVTEKLQIEKSIIAEKELSDSIINSLPGIFYLYEQDTGRFIRWNDNLEKVTGYSGAEIKQMHPIDFYDSDEKVQIKKRIKDSLERKMPGVELLLFTKDKRKISYYYNSHVIEYQGIPCIMGMGFDITDRKTIEQELQISHRKLEKKAGELINSYSELERFAYIVSHDLQEPLRMVTSFLKLFEKKYKGQLDETGEKYIYYAVDGAERMKQLIMDLLEYSRTGTNRDVTEDTDMNEMIDDVLKVLKNAVEETGANIQYYNLPVLPQASKVQMFQLMQNLVGNALKYHGPEKPIITINAAEQPTHWLFSINDNGIGIDPKFAEKIFIIFQRLHNKTEFSGTGIGLSICRKIVEKHGGKIWVESSGVGGSTFYFTIGK